MDSEDHVQLSMSMYMRINKLIASATAEQLLAAKAAIMAENWHEVECLLATN